MFKILLRKINNMLARGKLLELKPAIVPTVKVGLLAQEIFEGIEYAQDFGLKSSPPMGSQVITAHFGGNRNHATVLKAWDKEVIPSDELAAGETMLYNAHGAKIILKSNGEIEINSANAVIKVSDGQILIDAAIVGITGDLVVGGTINGVTIPS